MLRSLSSCLATFFRFFTITAYYFCCGGARSSFVSKDRKSLWPAPLGPSLALQALACIPGFPSAPTCHAGRPTQMTHLAQAHNPHPRVGDALCQPPGNASSCSMNCPQGFKQWVCRLVGVRGTRILQNQLQVDWLLPTASSVEGCFMRRQAPSGTHLLAN